MKLAVALAIVASAVLALSSMPERNIRPISSVPLHGDAQIQERLGNAVQAADIGLGIPCAVYRNGPIVQLAYPPRGATVVFVCGIP